MVGRPLRPSADCVGVGGSGHNSMQPSRCQAEGVWRAMPPVWARWLVGVASGPSSPAPQWMVVSCL